MSQGTRLSRVSFVHKEAGLITACSCMVVWEGDRTSWCKLQNLLQYCVWQQISKPVVMWWEQVTDTLFVWFCFVCVKEAMNTLCHSTKACWCLRFTLISVPSCRIMFYVIRIKHIDRNQLALVTIKVLVPVLTFLNSGIPIPLPTCRNISFKMCDYCQCCLMKIFFLLLHFLAF